MSSEAGWLIRDGKNAWRTQGGGRKTSLPGTSASWTPARVNRVDFLFTDVSVISVGNDIMMVMMMMIIIIIMVGKMRNEVTWQRNFTTGYFSILDACVGKVSKRVALRPLKRDGLSGTGK